MRNNISNIYPHRKKFKIDIGIIIFIFLLVYIISISIIYLTTTHTIGHEVKIGSLTESRHYKGFISRDETIYNSIASGYMNFFVRSGERVAVNNIIYTIDETGDLFDKINSTSELDDSTINEKNTIIKNEIYKFCENFTSKDFQTIYDFKFDLNDTILRLSSSNYLNQIDLLSKTNLDNTLKSFKSTDTGIVALYTDGYEGFTEEQLSLDIFNNEDYEKKQYLPNELIVKNDSLFKIITDENWSIYTIVEADIKDNISDGDYVKVKFSENQNISWAIINFIEKNGTTFARLDFNNSMSSFVSKRYVNIEIILEDQEGFKIPNSAIVDRTFSIVPKEYITKQNKQDNNVVLMETFNDEGEKVIEFVPINIYQENENEYYIDSSELVIGDYILKPDSIETYQISKQDTLKGVYNINKGYADFKQITILQQNDEYSIVKSNSKYGLDVYDYIVLDATKVKVDEFIY